MLEDLLEVQIERLEQVKKGEQEIKNQEEQKREHTRFQQLIDKTNDILKALIFTKEEFEFKLSEETKAKLKKLIIEENAKLDNPYGLLKNVFEVQDQYTKIEADVKKEWEKHYGANVKQTIGEMKTINKLQYNPKIVANIDLLEQGKRWSTDINNLKRIKIAKDESKQMYDNLHLDHEILDFLHLVGEGKATLLNMNNRIFEWIQANDLEKNFHFRF